MTAAEWGVLLLCCALPGEEKPLSLPQFQELGRRARALGCRGDDPLRELTARDIARLGYDAAQSARITRLLAREAQLEQYLRAAAAQAVFGNVSDEWFESAEVTYADGFEDLSLNDLMAKLAK